MKNIIIIITSILIVSACKKEKEDSSLNGKIVNVITKEPVSDVRVKVCDGLRWVGGDTEDGNCQLTYTNKDGQFDANIESNDPHLYFYKEGYEFNNYAYGGVTQVIGLKGGKHTNLLYEIEPKCEFVPTYISKENPAKEHTLITNIGQNYRKKYTFHENYDDIYVGRSPFVSNFWGYLTFIGDMHVVYRLRFERNGQNQEIIDSVFLKQGEIFRDTIYY